MLADVADGNKYAEYSKLRPFQKINHFPGIFELGNKRWLSSNMAKARAIFGPTVYDFFPFSFTLPGQREEWEKEYRRVQQLNPSGEQLWALKMGATDRGEGVSVINSIEQVPTGARAVLQRYINNPYLLHGYKFTMRIYMLITSFDPLRIYLHDDGFAHIAIEKYQASAKFFDRKHMHLTNPDISKRQKFYKENPRPFYWSLKEVRQYMRERGVDVAVVWKRIHQLLLKTVMIAEENFVMRMKK